jgi:hypothetical protein
MTHKRTIAMTWACCLATAFWSSLWASLLWTSPLWAETKGDFDEAIQATSEGFTAAKDTAAETKAKLEKALETYKTIKEYVSGAKGTELVDKLYATRGITDHTKVTELRGKLQDVVRALDQAGIEGKLEHASKILGQFDDIAGNATDALKFMDRFNPEGSRGDPTRGLRTIGAAIEDAAGGLPWPMDEIFKEYAQTTTSFSKKLDDLQQKIQQNTRQGSLGGSYASYAEAQEFFEKNFEGKDGRVPTTFLDVSYAFPLLGRSVQIFQNVGDNSGEYYIFSLEDARGSLVPAAFATAYRYFAALPDLTVIPPSERPSVLIARASSNNLTAQIAEAEQLRRTFEEARSTKEQLLRANDVWDTLGVLLLYGGDAFVGFYLFDPEKHAEIIKIRDILAGGGALTRVRVLVVDDEEGDPIPTATVTLGKFVPVSSGGGSAEYDLPLGTFAGSVTAPKFKSSGFTVTVAAPEGMRKLSREILNFAGKTWPALKPALEQTVKLESTEEKDDKEADAGAEDPTKFSVLLGAGNTELDPGEKTTVTATVKNGKPPLQFQWTIDGLAMPGRNEPTLPITFAKLGAHSIGVTVKDSSSPTLEAASNIDLFVGKTNDPDLVGRWSGTVKILEFKSEMPEVDAQSIGKVGPASLWIAPDGTGSLKVLTTQNGYFCHPSEQVARNGQSLTIQWQGPSALIPQSTYLTVDVKCRVDLVLDQGHLKGTLESDSTSTLSLPNNPVRTSFAHSKTCLEASKTHADPGPPPAIPNLSAVPPAVGNPVPGATNSPHPTP